MFDPKMFEDKIYTFVTRELNKATKALIDNKAELQVNSVQFFKEVIRALNSVTEEISVQTLYGLITLAEARHQKAKFIPLFRMKASEKSQFEKL